MSLFNTRSFNIRRYDAGHYDDNGRWIEGNEAVVPSITGTAQPSNGNSVKTLLEGKRISGLYEIITSTALQVADPKTFIGGDEIEYDNEWWTIIKKEDWQNNILNHYVYVIAKPRELL